jgi:hypothetical protein
VAVEAARAAGLDCADARLLRERSAALVELPRAGVMARVEQPGCTEQAERQVRVARFYADRGAPTARLAACPGQPVERGGCAVTFWELLVPVARRVTPRAIGALLRALHGAAGPPLDADLPGLDPVPAIRWFQERPAIDLGSETTAAFDRLLEERERDWRAWAHRDPLGLRLLHGDLHADNVVVTARGPVLVDLEDSGVGPASWDLAVPAVGVRRYGHRAEDLEDVLDAYGADPRSWQGFETLCRIYEHSTAAWSLHCAGRSRSMEDEARKRVATLTGGLGGVWAMC